MAKFNRDISCVSVFYSFSEAMSWVHDVLYDELDDDKNHVKEIIIKIMPGGSYRAGVLLADNQQDLFGEIPDA